MTPASAAIAAIEAAAPSRCTTASAARSRPSRRDSTLVGHQGIWCPEIARLMISRWISLVPSKIV